MKKTLFLFFTISVLFTGCEFKFLRILQPNTALVNTEINYPIDIYVTKDEGMDQSGYLVLEIPPSMSLNTNEVLASFLVNGEAVNITSKDSLTNIGNRAYQFDYMPDNDTCFFHVSLVMSLNIGTISGEYSIAYKTGSNAYNEVNETRTLTVQNSAIEQGLMYAQCMDSIGSLATPLDFYIKYIGESSQEVSQAKLILSRGGAEDLSFDMSALGVLGQDYFACVNVPSAGDYTYFIYLVLADNSVVRYPATGNLTGPKVTNITSVTAPFLEDFEESSTTRDMWTVTDGPISLSYGIPAANNFVSAYACEGSYALGSNITGNGFYNSENSGYSVSPYLKVDDAEEILFNFKYKTYASDAKLSHPISVEVSGGDDNWLPILSITDSLPQWNSFVVDLRSLSFGDYVRFRFFCPANDNSLEEGVMFDNIGVNATPNPIDLDFVDVQESVASGERYSSKFYIYNRGDVADNYTIRVYNAKLVGDATDYVVIEDFYGNALGETGVLSPGASKSGVFVLDLPETPDDDSYEYLVKVWSQADPSIQRMQTITVDVDKDSSEADNFGYTWINNRNENCTPFDWVSTEYHRTIPSEEINYALNFINGFDFYGDEYYSFYLNPKGYITFGNSSQESEINAIPNAITPNAYVSFLANDTRYIDLKTEITEGTVNGWGAQKEKMKVITFHNISNHWGNAQMDVQIMFNDLYDMRIQYNHIDPDFDLDRYHVGIENAYGTDGLQYQHSLGRLRDSLVIEFRYPGRENFSELYPATSDYEDVSVFAEMSWLPPRGAQSVCLYLAEMNTPLDSSTIVYSGDRIVSFDPELEPNTFYDYVLEAVLGDGSVLRSTKQQFKTMRNMVSISGQVYAEDGTTPAPNVPITMKAYCLLQGTYEVSTLSDEFGYYAIDMPACEELNLEIESKMCDPYSQTVLLKDTTEEGLFIYNDIIITTNPVFTEFTFNVDDEIIEELDTTVYYYVSPSTSFWYGGLRYLTADVSFAPGVISTLDFDTVVGYDHRRTVELTTIGGRSKTYQLRYSSLAGLHHFLEDDDFCFLGNGMYHFGAYSITTYRALDLNNKGASYWEDDGVSMSTTRPDWVGKDGKKWSVGMAPASFVIRPTDPADRINMVRFNIFENCGEGCTQATAYRGHDIVDQVIPEAFEEKVYRLRMYSEPADRVQFTSYESTVNSITVWLEKGGASPEICTEVLCNNVKLNDTSEVAVEIYQQDETDSDKWERIRAVTYYKSGKYWTKLVPGKYVLRAIPANPDSLNFNPTYSGDAATWTQADTITLNYQDIVEYTINSTRVETLQGSHSISGSIEVIKTVSKSTSTIPTAFGYRVILYDAVTDIPIAYALTDPSGNYVFDNLPEGNYYVVADREEMQESRKIDIEVKAGNATVEVPSVFYFYEDQGQIRTTDTPTLQKEYPEKEVNKIEVYPNPAHTYITIRGVDKNVSYALLNELGVSIKSGRYDTKLMIGDLSSGIYFLYLDVLPHRQMVKIIKL